MSSLNLFSKLKDFQFSWKCISEEAKRNTVEWPVSEFKRELARAIQRGAFTQDQLGVGEEDFGRVLQEGNVSQAKMLWHNAKCHGRSSRVASVYQVSFEIAEMRRYLELGGISFEGIGCSESEVNALLAKASTILEARKDELAQLLKEDRDREARLGS